MSARGDASGAGLAIAVIGAGVSGIAAARSLMRFGHAVTVYERAERIGGIWTHTYPGVTLQNVAEHYRLTEFPWPFEPDLHPTAEQVLRYLDAAAEAFGIDVRTGHEVTRMVPVADGWDVTVAAGGTEETRHFDRVVIAVGLYGGAAERPHVPGEETFAGRIVGDAEVEDLAMFEGRRVAVVGFGKTALDLVSFAATRAAQAHHVFRAPRWLPPRTVFGHHMSESATARTTVAMLPSWIHPGAWEARMHARWRWLVDAYWRMAEMAMRLETGLHPYHRDPGARARMALLEPGAPLTYHMRAAAALAPDGYYEAVGAGRILPHRGTVARMVPQGLVLDTGEEIAADLVVFATGRPPPDFPFLPPGMRALMTTEADGAQLYRHVLHPAIPNLAFAGYNHAFLHIACVEIAMLWWGAVLAGDIVLPPPAEMAASAARVAEWKRANALFEPTRAWGIGGRVHQYLGVLLAELGVRDRRKATAKAERTAPYFAGDYAGVFDEYRAARAARGAPIVAFPADT